MNIPNRAFQQIVNNQSFELNVQNDINIPFKLPVFSKIDSSSYAWKQRLIKLEIFPYLLGYMKLIGLEIARPL